MAVYYKTYNEVDYIYFDARGISDLKIIEETLELNKYIESSEDYSIRLIINVTNLNIGIKTYFGIREAAKKSQNKIMFSSFVGMTKHTKAIFKMYRKFTKSRTRLFDHLEEALQYITQPSEKIVGNSTEEKKAS